MISGVLLDVAGVIYVGETAVPGAIDAVARLRGAGLPLRFVTNTTRSPRRAILARLRALGVSVGDNEIFTPAIAACQWLTAHACSPHLLIHPDLAEDFANCRQGNRPAVVVGDAGHGFTYQSLNQAFRALHAGADLLALAHNRSFRDADGELSLDAGAFVAGLEYASGRHARLLGKPAQAFYASALSSMGCPATNAVMVGDDADADVAGALAAGLGQAILVRTGKYVEGDESRFKPPPTVVLSDLSAAAEWILANRERPA